MSHCTVPTWNSRHQRQQQAVEAEEANQYPHVQNQQNQINHFMPMSKCEKVAELTWENRQIGMHGVGGILSMSQTKPTILGRTGDTLESIVHQATHHGQNQTSIQNYDQNQNLKIGMCVGKWGESSQHKMAPGATVLAKKRMRSESEPQYSGKLVGEDEYAERSACASASATFCRENDTAMVTWPSFDESSRSIKSKTTCDEDSACHDGGSENKEEEHETKRSNSSRRSRAAVVHNQSERRRRDRINQKMKALQRLVPNASKTDKASMLDEVINYLKQLQAQVQLMNSVRNMAPQMMMPLGMHQHIQMSLLARMGMGVGLGMGMGMFDMTALARAAAATAAAAAAPPHQSLTTHPLIHTNPIATPATPFIPSAFAMPAASAIPSAAQANNTVGKATTAPVTPATTTTSNSAPFTDTYSAFLTQSMDMEYYNNMAALYRQQANNHSTQTTCSKLNQENLNIQGQRE